MLLETGFAALLRPRRVAALPPRRGGVHRCGHQLLQWNKLDLARAQLFLEGERRGAVLLLISQKTFSWNNPPLAVRCVEPQGGRL